MRNKAIDQSRFIAAILVVIILAELGRRYSRDIYVFHTIVIGAVNILASIIKVLNNQMFLIIRPFAVLAICIAGLWVLYKLLPLKNKAVKD